MGTIIDFEPEEDLGPAPPLPGRPPAWAQHLHDCVHKSRTEARAVARKCDLILSRLGEESDDGKGGKGIVGEVRRATSDIRTLQGERNMVRGAILTLTLGAAALVYAFRAWVQSLVGGQHG